MAKIKRKMTDIVDVDSVNIMMGTHLYNAIHQYNRMHYVTTNHHIDRTSQCADSLLGPNDFIMKVFKTDFKSQVCLEVKAYWHKSDDRNKMF